MRETCPFGSKCPAEKRLHEVALAIISRSGRPKEEAAWLIEFSERVSQQPTYYGKTDDGLGQTTDHLKAVRYARKEDADAVIEDTGWTEATATEHMWIGPSSNSQLQQ